MSVCFVVHDLTDWPHAIPGVSVIDARSYLEDSAWADAAGAIVNLCKSCCYQSRGYYVSLLAEARGQRPLPDVRTIEDIDQSRLLRLLTERLDDTIRQALGPLDGHALTLDICFGRDTAHAQPALARELFDCLRLPLLRARFERDDGPLPNRRRGWRLVEARALGPADVRPIDRALMAEAAAAWVREQDAWPAAARPARTRPPAPAIAILQPASTVDAPSNPQAIARFRAAAEALGMRCALLTAHEIERVGEFDALFVRDTTRVGHHTYRFARRAAALGLVVIDDPDSILKCGNKVYLHELLRRHGIDMPRTLMVHQDNVDRIVPALGLPCILKRPDGAFSLGVEKVATPEALARTVAGFLRESELIVAQEYLPTEFDWRVGVLDGRALFACKYFMAPGHWQVIKRDPGGAQDRVEGSTVACALQEVPGPVLDVALRGAALIGDGFYGVDIKQAGERCCIIEINDNPSVDAGNEDGVLGEALYREVMAVFLHRIRARRAGSAA